MKPITNCVVCGADVVVDGNDENAGESQKEI